MRAYDKIKEEIEDLEYDLECLDTMSEEEADKKYGLSVYEATELLKDELETLYDELECADPEEEHFNMDWWLATQPCYYNRIGL